jgi:hypothetical protein
MENLASANEQPEGSASAIPAWWSDQLPSWPVFSTGRDGGFIVSKNE